MQQSIVEPLVFTLSSSARYTLWCGIAIYVLVMIFIGLISSKKIKGMKDFLVANRRLPLWMATATLLATWFGAGSSMGVTATVFSDGLGGVIASPFADSISLIIAGIFVVGILRKLKCLTVTDIIERRYGKSAGIYASAWMMFVYIGWVGSQVKALGVLLNVVTGINPLLGTCISAVVVLIYTFAGGMWAVTMTDALQVSLIVVGLFLIVPGAIGEAGGWDVITSRISEADLYMGVSGTGGINDYVYYIGSWIVMGLGCTVGQDVIQRALSCKNEQIAVASTIMSGFLYAMLGFIPIVIGFAARVVLAKHNITSESMGGDIENQVLPHMAMIVLGQMHPIFLTLFLAALISVIMSSADSSLLAGSSLLCNNIIRPFCPKLGDRKLLTLTRISTVFLTFLGTILALYIDSIYQLMINSWLAQLVIVFVPVMTAIYVPKASRNCAWVTMIVSTAVWFAYTYMSVIGTNLEFVDLLNSAKFEYDLTCGAVYAFAVGLLAFIFSYLGEVISKTTPTKKIKI